MPKQMSRHSAVLKSPRRQARKLAPHSGEPSHGPLTADELQLAVRNHSMPLEALRIDTTPPGLHYVLTHFDIPFIDAEHWHLQIGRLRANCWATPPWTPESAPVNSTSTASSSTPAWVSR